MMKNTHPRRVYRRSDATNNEKRIGEGSALLGTAAATLERVVPDREVRAEDAREGRPDDAKPVSGKDGEGGGAERRRFRRTRVLWGGTLRLVEDGSTLSVTLANVSASGAKLMFTTVPGREEAEVIAKLRPKLRVVLLLPGTAAIPAEVVWVGRGSLGIAFMVEPDEAVRRLGRVARLE